MDGGLENYPEAGSSANIGVMLVRPSANDFARVRPQTLILRPLSSNFTVLSL